MSYSKKNVKKWMRLKIEKRKGVITILNLENYILADEIADLFKSNPQTIRYQVEKGKIYGFGSGAIKIPRMRFYKDCGWYTDDEVRHAYKMAGMELKEKVDSTKSTQND